MMASGIGAIIASFLFYAAATFSDGPFTRPHPVVWRITQGVGLCYLFLLVFLFMQVRPTPPSLSPLSFVFPFPFSLLPARVLAMLHIVVMTWVAAQAGVGAQCHTLRLPSPASGPRPCADGERGAVVPYLP